MQKVGLDELAPYLKDCHVKLDSSFLNKLLNDSSKSSFPHRDLEFVKNIDCPVNKNKKSSLTIYGWIKGYRTVPISKLIKIIELSNYTWKDVEKHLICIKSGIRNGEINPKFPIEIGKEIGSIVGHILGDGSIPKRFHPVFFSNSNIELLKEFNDNMEKLFGISPRIWVQEKTLFHEKSKWLKKVDSLEKIPHGYPVGLFYPKICSDILYILFGNFAEGKDKKITDKIKSFNNEFKIALIRAFFDDEGSINSDNYTMRFHQDRKDILEDIRKMLDELGIKSNEVRSYLKRDKLRYYFNITGFREYYNYYNLVGCISSSKKREFELLINKVKNSSQFKKKYSL